MTPRDDDKQKVLTAADIERLAGFLKPWRVTYKSRGDITFVDGIYTADGKCVCDFRGCEAATTRHAIDLAKEIVEAVNAR